MKRNVHRFEIDLTTFDKATPYHQNRMLLECLSDDDTRAKLFENINSCRNGVLQFKSQARYEELPSRIPASPDTQYRDAFLITSGDLIRRALATEAQQFSNSPYAALGTGGFMLALDTSTNQSSNRRALQHQTAINVFAMNAAELQKVCDYAFGAALPTALATSDFDLAALAEEVAVRFCSALFGYASSDFPLLEDALRKGYGALNYQILGRHFLTQPLLLPDSKMAMGKLLARTTILIDEYQLARHDLPEDIEGDGACISKQQRVMCKLALDTGELTGEERAVLVVGSMVGIVGNVQASVCLALQRLFSKHASGLLQAGLDAARLKDDNALLPILAEALRLNPPVAFLPRRACEQVDWTGAKIPKDAECILALGGGSRAETRHPDTLHPLIFGLDDPDDKKRGIHWCLGKHLALPLIERICRGVLRLPGLAEQLDPLDGLPIGLEKQWGFRCVSYPLRHRRDLRFYQQPLNVVMRIRMPMAANAEALRNVIRSGAPRIERVLRESRHVHFAWFEFIDNDSKLVLHTVYDGDFNAYIQHFALVVGDVFDRLFRYIEDAPPLPVSDFPNEFVATIRRFNRAPAAGFFFSAYPRTEAAQITRLERGNKP